MDSIDNPILIENEEIPQPKVQIVDKFKFGDHNGPN
jgi:hypothetical protein